MQIFPPLRDTNALGTALRRRFPVRVYVEMRTSPYRLYPDHWRFYVKLFGIFLLEINRPFKNPGMIDPWWRAKGEVK